MNVDTLYLVVEPGNRLGARYWFRRKKDTLRFIARSRDLYPHHPISEVKQAISRPYFQNTYRGDVWVLNELGWVAGVFPNRHPGSDKKATRLVYHE